ncbi:MAG: potassium channel family protein [Tepidibacter sp.]|jgi:voltage-gated potassium channel|uniref:potassium channel family protein n=1 Tax=Tepidibacter sp. TaxID=2529387 RepID=UPI0025E9B4F0|nr:potassium channel family protein [Tepidibacter sp.]MCT4509827.1 potassium channel family protein [Tepidibacter sp.]
MINVFIHAIKTLYISLEKSNIYKLLTVGLFSLFTCSVAFYFYESPINPGLNFGDSLWWGFVTCTTVGYGDYYPVTSGGRIIGIILMLVGISAFGFITAAVASVFIENKLKEGLGLMDIKFKNHIAIIGWNNKSEIILQELIQDNPDKKIVIIDEREKLVLEYKNTFFVHGDPTKDETLAKANIENAHTVIVVADEKLNNEGMADAKSVLICLAVDKLNTNIHLIAEVLNKENVTHFQRANVNDIIISNEMSSRVMVRSALYKNVSQALKELLTSSYGNEIYEGKVNNEDIGITFKNLVSKYIERYNAVILGIANKDVLLNPDKDYIIDKDDIIIYISKEKL